MALARIQLDDLTWDDMVAAIRRRIPAESAGNWTLHAPVDPGVTLLELFAWLAEQRLYWLDQVPDAFVVAVLKLLGLDGPLPAIPAATVLQFTVPDKVDSAVVVPAGAGFTRDPRQQVVFTLDDAVTVLPVRSLTLETGGQDRTGDLMAGRGVALLPADRKPGQARISLVLAGGVAPGHKLSLLFDLLSPGISPAWSPSAVDGVPPAAELTWSYDDGTLGPIDPAQVEDGTQGLRRSGIVRLPVPASWASGAGTRSVLLSTSQATFAPPRLQQLVVNVAAARHQQAIAPDDGTRAKLATQIKGWLRLPGQQLDLPLDTQDRLLDASLTLQERDRAAHEWVPVADFACSGRADRVFILDRAAGALRFGDGRTGRIPAPDPDSAEPLPKIRWTVGGGAEGNGGTTSNWRGINGTSVAATVANVMPAAGGVDAETIAQARSRAGAALHEAHRAVTAADHETIARATPGVAVKRAHAAVGDHPGFPCDLVPGAVSVYVVPDVPRGDGDWDRPDFVAAPRPDPGLLSHVRAALCAARLLGEELFVREPRYRPARLRVDVAGAQRNPADVRRRIQAALRKYLDPLVGGPENTGWVFGAPLRPSALLRLTQQAAGHDGDVRAVAIALDDADRWEDCRDVPIRPQELVVLGDVRVRFGAAPGAAAVEGLQ
ncbi:MAG TPA: baseplate J/gp47 family protein [Mycobacterium sp.]|nr:baseplate J/gp47 family protein [Mycobacterium sp.]